MKKAIELMNQMIPMKKEVKKTCIAYLKRVLEKCNNNYLSFYDEDGEAYGNRYVSVTYDGGNHPEYESNAFSTVKGVFIDKYGDICLDTEDDDAYAIENINLEELYDIAEYVYADVEETINQ